MNLTPREKDKLLVAMAAIVRHWSTVLNGMQVDLATFKQETDGLLGGGEEGTSQ
jgi:hypothetical protein